MEESETLPFRNANNNGLGLSKFDILRFSKDAIEKNNRDLVVLHEEESDPKYGHAPQERPIREYLKYGFIALDKPQGPTSHEVVAWVRRILEIERAGHSGTLDPIVSGVLPIGLESATKALSVLLLGPKEYIAIARIHDSVPEAKFYEALNAFTGVIFQRPPQRSSVRRTTRTREIYRVEIIEKVGNLALIRVLCEAGTYIRKFIYDIGEVLQVGATMAELRRTRVCQICEVDLVRLHDLFEAKAVFGESGNESKLRRIVHPIEEPVSFLKQIRVRDSAVESICHGAQLAAPGVTAFTRGLEEGELVRIITGKGELVAIAESKSSGEKIKTEEHGIVAATRRVIMEPGTYPKMWKSKDERALIADQKREEEEDERKSLSGEALIRKSILDRLEEEEAEQEEQETSE